MMGDSLKTTIDTLIYNSKLNKLKPIILPEPIEFEPVTLGWYIALGLIIIIFLYLFYKLVNNYNSNAYRRLAANELSKIKSIVGENDSSIVIQQISTILKITAIKSYSREKIARLYGKDWQQFLVSSVPSGAKYKSAFALLNAQYIPNKQNSISANELQKLIDASIKWIRGHRV